MPLLYSALQRIGLEHYHDRLVENGFDSWEAVCDISESDLAQLGFKLGHRRLLQRIIANHTAPSDSHLLDGFFGDGNNMEQSADSDLERAHSPKIKRKYQHRPKPDPSAPVRPKSGYVMFSEHLREDPAVSALSFVEIAKLAGEAWRALSAEGRQHWENQSATAMDVYRMQLDEYQATPSYRQYQNYILDFKRWHSSKGGRARRPLWPPGAASMSRKDRLSSALGVASSSCSSTLVSDSRSIGVASPAGSGTWQAVQLAMQRLSNSPARHSELYIRLYAKLLNRFPPREVVYAGITAFFSNTSLFWLWSKEEGAFLFEQVYSSNAPPDVVTVAEVFAMAATGAKLATDPLPQYVVQTFYALATRDLEECVTQEPLRAMRIIFCLALFSICDKSMYARLGVAAALQIARWKLLPRTVTWGAQDDWPKVFRSLVFVECWLSSSLGCPSDLTTEEMEYGRAGKAENTASIDELTYAQTIKIGELATRIARGAERSSGNAQFAMDSATESVTAGMARLEAWHQNLPPVMRLAHLTLDGSSVLTKSQRMRLFMVHMTYLDSIILLHRQSMVSAARRRLQATQAAETYNEQNRTHEEDFMSAARHLARFVTLMEDGDSCTVFLFNVAQKLLYNAVDDVEADLAFAKNCIATLERCGMAERIACQYLYVLKPAYDTLRGMFEASRSPFANQKSGIHTFIASPAVAPRDLYKGGVDGPYPIFSPAPPLPLPLPLPVAAEVVPETIREEVLPIAEALSMLLEDPFGRNERSGIQEQQVLESQVYATVNGACGAPIWWEGIKAGV
ncbi:hypothetical protein H2199_007043 [Coniosporium tulheliwenetii]|uniref:Uncharacterized protein n=1 Tax=Coniosporium tulheliwenetii TaxID=3383036 RepID=A0ACC2YSU8_9PEZI|nr:hypothetical protein H2199_007043 [Cladosporium sp. JES 115]